MKDYKIIYEFQYSDGSKKVYSLVLDAKTTSLKIEKKKQLPEWTKLECGKCSMCPLNEKDDPRCPLAVNISDLVESFKDERSTDNVLVKIQVPERAFVKTASVQDGLYSILGVVMATSDCPNMNFLKPMARFHLPFSTSEETVFRSTSIHLLRQYFAYKKGEELDLDLQKLNDHYKKVQNVNQGILQRMSTVYKKGDANQNALVILDAFAKVLTMDIEDQLQSMEYLFGDK